MLVRALIISLFVGLAISCAEPSIWDEPYLLVYENEIQMITFLKGKIVFHNGKAKNEIEILPEKPGFSFVSPGKVNDKVFGRFTKTKILESCGRIQLYDLHLFYSLASTVSVLQGTADPGCG